MGLSGGEGVKTSFKTVAEFIPMSPWFYRITQHLNLLNRKFGVQWDDVNFIQATEKWYYDSNTPQMSYPIRVLNL